MSFDTTVRYFAFDAALLADAETLRGSLGDLASTAPDHNGQDVQTLLCGLDNADTGKLRALVLGQTAIPLTLTDGRLCLGGHWATGVKAAFEGGQIEGEELTAEQVKSLTPQSEI
jgi:hypothetical protein